jgi:hypothetical protein
MGESSVASVSRAQTGPKKKAIRVPQTEIKKDRYGDYMIHEPKDDNTEQATLAKSIARLLTEKGYPAQAEEPVSKSVKGAIKVTFQYFHEGWGGNDDGEISVWDNSVNADWLRSTFIEQISLKDILSESEKKAAPEHYNYSRSPYPRLPIAPRYVNRLLKAFEADELRQRGMRILPVESGSTNRRPRAAGRMRPRRELLAQADAVLARRRRSR